MKTIYAAIAGPHRISVSDNEMRKINRGRRQVDQFPLDSNMGLELDIRGIGRYESGTKTDLITQTRRYNGKINSITELGYYDVDGFESIHEGDFLQLPQVYIAPSFIDSLTGFFRSAESPLTVLAEPDRELFLRGVVEASIGVERNRRMGSLCLGIIKGQREFSELVEYDQEERVKRDEKNKQYAGIEREA